jgi:hypothetical protein
MMSKLRRLAAPLVASAVLGIGASTAAASAQRSTHREMWPNSPFGRCMEAGGPLAECWYWSVFLR